MWVAVGHLSSTSRSAVVHTHRLRKRTTATAGPVGHIDCTVVLVEHCLLSRRTIVDKEICSVKQIVILKMEVDRIVPNQRSLLSFGSEVQVSRI